MFRAFSARRHKPGAELAYAVKRLGNNIEIFGSAVLFLA